MKVTWLTPRALRLDDRQAVWSWLAKCCAAMNADLARQGQDVFVLPGVHEVGK